MYHTTQHKKHCRCPLFVVLFELAAGLWGETQCSTPTTVALGSRAVCQPIARRCVCVSRVLYAPVDIDARPCGVGSVDGVLHAQDVYKKGVYEERWPGGLIHGFVTLGGASLGRFSRKCIVTTVNVAVSVTVGCSPGDVEVAAHHRRPSDGPRTCTAGGARNCYAQRMNASVLFFPLLVFRPMH